MKRKRLSNSTRLEIAARQYYKCAHCNSVLTHVFEIDHKIPWALCKSNEKNNLQALCSNCHALKTNKDNKKMRNMLESYFCDCDPEYEWKGKENFKKHKKSNKHLLYENKQLKKENEKLQKQIIDWKNIFYFNNPDASKSPV